MHGPAMAAWLLVALCAAAGASCLLRLRGNVDEQRGTAGAEALMAFGMAAMAVPAAVLAPPRWVWLVYAAVFGWAALRTLAPGRRTAHHAHHLVGTLAMVYMATAMAATPGGMGGADAMSGAHGGMHATHTAGGAPLVTGVLLIYYAGYVLWAGARLLPLPVRAAPESGTVTAGWGAGAELAPACRLSMGLAMLAMLLAL